MSTLMMDRALDQEERLQKIGLKNLRHAFWNLSTAALYEEAIRRNEAGLCHGGALRVVTQPYTGRLPNDKFIVREPSSEDKICWGKVNKPIESAKFEALKNKMTKYLQGKDIFIQDCFACADERYQAPIRIITERATHSFFARTMFIRHKDPNKLREHVPAFTVLQVPGFKANPKTDGVRSEAFILLNFAQKLILIGGTAYAGEIKKAIFTVMNYLLPLQGVLSMHCSANYGKDEDDVAIFFGLSGTGKTTLSAVPDRTLIGDDEHGWCDHGVFNIEGGCYAKVIRLSPEGEPEIFETTRRFGTLLENVGMDNDSKKVNLYDESITENTRASYPIQYIPNMTLTGTAHHPRNIIMLTCDAFGVLPPISRLSREQAVYHFLSGYTARVAGTEAGITEPQATFSTCFGAPFMPLSPAIYADLLGKKIAAHHVDVWLINTGWTGGPAGVGQRINLSLTRAMVKAIVEGKLKDVPTKKDPIFGMPIPVDCPDVPKQILKPKNTWGSKREYDKKAKELASMFIKHFQEIAPDAPEDIVAAGPKA